MCALHVTSISFSFSISTFVLLIDNWLGILANERRLRWKCVSDNAKKNVHHMHGTTLNCKHSCSQGAVCFRYAIPSKWAIQLLTVETISHVNLQSTLLHTHKNAHKCNFCYLTPCLTLLYSTMQILYWSPFRRFFESEDDILPSVRVKMPKISCKSC